MDADQLAVEYPLFTILRQVQGPQLNTIVHVGAHIGQEIMLYQELKPRRVLWVEGDPEIIPRLEQTIRDHGDGRTAHVIAHALITDRDGEEATLRRFNNEGASSSIFGATDRLRTTFPGLDETGEAHPAQSRTLASVLRDQGISASEVSALVIDIQGAELLCLRGLGDDIGRIPFIEVEVSVEPIYENAPAFAELDAYLSGRGFRSVTPVRNHGNVVYVNPSFVKQETELQSREEIQTIEVVYPLYELLRDHRPLPVVDTIVHVGAHAGQERDKYEEVGARRVVWIEGDPGIYQTLVEQLPLGASGRTEHIAVNALILDRDGESVTLNRFNGEGQASSIFRPTHLLGQVFAGVGMTDGVVQAPSLTLATALGGIGIEPDRISALVIDIQGAELHCLKGAGPYLDHVPLLEVEASSVPFYEGAPLFAEVDDFLRARGFEQITEALAHGDVLYAHPDRIQLSPEARQAMATIWSRSLHGSGAP